MTFGIKIDKEVYFVFTMVLINELIFKLINFQKFYLTESISEYFIFSFGFYYVNLIKYLKITNTITSITYVLVLKCIARFIRRNWITGHKTFDFFKATVECWIFLLRSSGNKNRLKCYYQIRLSKIHNCYILLEGNLNAFV